MELALFPLKVQLLPGGIMPLRIFEPRFLRMLSESQGGGFGLCTLGEPRAAGGTPLMPIGTRVEIIDFDWLTDETLGIQVRGLCRFHISSLRTEADGLLRGQVEPLPNWPVWELGPELQILADKLGEIFEENPDYAAYYPEPQWANACWVVQRWLEMLPLPAEHKCGLIAGTDCSDALRFLMTMLHEPLRLH